MINENANGTIQGRCAVDSKEIDERDLPNEKHNGGTISGWQFWCFDWDSELLHRYGHVILFLVGSDHCILLIFDPSKNVPSPFQDIG
jgi:hypothetical protein